MIRKILTNPFVVLGIVYVGYRMIKKKPSGAISRTFDEVVEGGGKIASTLGTAATSIIDTAVETGQDIFDIYDDGEELDAQGNLVNEDDPACL